MKRHSLWWRYALTTVTAICFATLTVLSGGIQATEGVVTYPDRAAWTAAVGAPTGGENFNGFTQDTPTDEVTVSIQGGTVTSVNNVSPPLIALNKIDVAPFQYPPAYQVDNTPYFLADTEGARVVTFDFAKPVTAWAADFRRTIVGIALPSTPRLDLYGSANEHLGSIQLRTDSPIHALEFYGFTLSGEGANETISRASSLRIRGMPRILAAGTGRVMRSA